VVNVTDRANVAVRLVTLEFFLGHRSTLGARVELSGDPVTAPSTERSMRPRQDPSRQTSGCRSGPPT
jgi:hypothetical protein